MDKTKNFVVGKVVTAPNPATTGTSITVSNGSLFPDPSTFGPYNLCVWSQADDPSPTTCEIVRVTAKTTSGNNTVLTVTRSQEGTTGLSIAAGWKVYYSLTQKYFDDLASTLESKLDITRFVHHEAVTGTVDGTNKAFSISYTPAGGYVDVIVGKAAYVQGIDYTVSGTTITFTTAPTLLSDNTAPSIRASYWKES